MASFAQWKSYSKSGKNPPQIIWVCGDYPSLTEEVVSDYRAWTEVPTYDVHFFHLFNKNEVLQKLNTQSFSDTGKIIILRNAEQVSDWSFLKPWLASKIDNKLVLLSGDKDLPKEKSSEGKWEVTEYIKLIQKSGYVVKCSSMTNEQITSWFLDKIKISKSMADYAVSRAGGDVKLLRDVTLKLKTVPASAISPAVINGIMQESTTLELSEGIFFRRKPLNLTGQENPLELVNRLSRKLDTLNKIVISGEKTTNGISEKTGISPFVVKSYLPVREWYSHQRVERLRRLLTLIESYAIVGATDGLVEALTANWA